MTQMKPGDVEFSIFPKPQLLVGKGKVTENIVEDLNNMCDDMLADPETPSYADKLVGEIHKGSQLQVDTMDKRFKQFKKLLKDATNIYINHYFESVGNTPIPYHLEVDDVWTVHQFEGDYNPLHDHGSEYFSAFAGFIHTMVPEQIIDRNNLNPESIYGAQGAMDGVTSLVWGDVGNRDRVIFKFPQTEYVVPEVGVFYLFPLWLNHVVYPFRGEGERRSISYNINVIWDDDYYDNPIPSKVNLKTSIEERIKNG
tara:strand:+ start:1235 stop:1999 length:765 start_codon:yes stop_codon:yes gene_type:complete